MCIVVIVARALPSAVVVSNCVPIPRYTADSSLSIGKLLGS